MAEFFEKDGKEYYTMVWGDTKFTQEIERHRDWQLLKKTSPSGKAMWRCRKCGRETVTPDKWCPVGEPKRHCKHDSAESTSNGWRCMICGQEADTLSLLQVAGNGPE